MNSAIVLAQLRLLSKTKDFKFSIDNSIQLMLFQELKSREDPKTFFNIPYRTSCTPALFMAMIPDTPPPKKSVNIRKDFLAFFIYFRTYVRRKPSYKTRQKDAQALDKDFHYPMYTTGPKVNTILTREK
jgi:hypothetical protein